MAKKIKPSSTMNKRRLIRAFINHNDDVNQTIKDAIKPTLQAREDLKDKIRIVTPSATKQTIDYLPIELGKLGFFIVDGQALDVLHTKDSAHGRLLKILYEHRREPISRKRLKKYMNDREIIQPLKDLRSQARRIGIEPDIRSNKAGGTVTFYGFYYK